MRLRRVVAAFLAVVLAVGLAPFPQAYAYADASGARSTRAAAALHQQLIAAATPGYSALYYDANGGSGEGPAPVFVKASVGTYAARNTFTPPSGKAFTNWNTARDGSGRAYSVGEAITIVSDTTLYAQWRDETFEVTYDANGATGKMDSSFCSPYGFMKLSPIAYKRRGYTFQGWALAKDGDAIYADSATIQLTSSMTLYAVWAKDSGATRSLLRVYNPRSQEHLYTADVNEVAVLTSEQGWRYEGVAWISPSKSATPVYRLYNVKTGDHHYTADKHERNVLRRIGWAYEGVSWYSDDEKGVPVYRMYNPWSATGIGTHHYTLEKHEANVLANQRGWEREGIGWYGMR